MLRTPPPAAQSVPPSPAPPDNSPRPPFSDGTSPSLAQMYSVLDVYRDK